MTLKEVNYTAGVASVFAAVGLALIMFFNLDGEHIQDNIFIILVLFGFVLAFPYFLLKFFFYVNSHHDDNEELHLKELPEYQDDVERKH